MRVVIYRADVGSVARGRFGWARSDVRPGEPAIEPHRGGTEIVELVEAVAADLESERAVALGFECPLYVPVPEPPPRLGAARAGEGNRSWSAGAGAGVLATGVAQVSWILDHLRRRTANVPVHLNWHGFARSDHGRLFLWEAFVSECN